MMMLVETRGVYFKNTNEVNGLPEDNEVCGREDKIGQGVTEELETKKLKDNDNRIQLREMGWDGEQMN